MASGIALDAVSNLSGHGQTGIAGAMSPDAATLNIVLAAFGIVAVAHWLWR